ncbi:MAG: fibronectin type III domain-containing protein [Lachnospiraceae bacterium]|nr:fibronectin type III domain-containing protein [Lachnospiraceae bacterium]
MSDTTYKWRMDDAGWGVPPQPPNFTVTAGNQQATLSWNVPEYTKVDDQIVCTAGGIRIRRSTAGYPANENSGELILDTTELTGTYTDENLTNGTTYYYRAFVYSDHNVFNRDKYKSKGSATPSEAAVISVVYTASDADGEEIEATDGNTTITATITNGVARFSVYDTGTWTVGGQQVEVPQLGTVVTLNEKLYGFDWTLPPAEADTESQIFYPSGVDNYGLTPVAARGADADISLGDMQEIHDFIGARPVMLNFDGTVAYELDHTDQTKKLDGTASDITDTSKNMNAMVEYPKRYIKRWTANGIGHCRISRVKLSDDYKCLPWLYGDDEATAVENDVIYMPMFEGGVASGKARSLAGLTPMNSQTGATEYSYISALGDGWQFDDVSDAAYIADLMFLMSKSTDVQKHWGYGHYTGGSGAGSLHTTGQLKSHGPYYGGTGNTDMKFMWMENWYADRWERTFGMYMINSIIYVKDFPPYTTDGNVTHYANTGHGITGTNGGYISGVTYDQHGLIPTAASGADGKYVPDGAWFTSGTLFLLRSCNCGNGFLAGLTFYLGGAFSNSGWLGGASPAYKKTHAA